jgi:hypothetical protein
MPKVTSMADAAGVSGVSVVIDDDDNVESVDPVTGTVTSPADDGGVIVQLDARRPKATDADDDPFYENLAERIPAIELGKISVELWDQVNADNQSRANYLAIRARGIELLGLEIKEPRANAADTSAAVEGLSTVTNPLLLEAVLKGWANAQAELLPSEGPVKIADDGNDGADTQGEDELAEAFERDMNYYLTTTASEYYPDTSHMLLWGTYFGGSGFKKVYRCPMRRRPVSESVDAKDLIVSDTIKDLRSCSRITHEIQMRPSVMKRMQLLGAYRDVSLPQPMAAAPNAVNEQIEQQQGTQTNQRRPEDQPYNLWETQCELDLRQYAPGKFKDEGIPLPYIVTMDKDSKEILAIRRDWKEDDDECERKRMYVKYPYVPGPGFYGTGMLNILGNSSMAMTAAWREALDAGMYANFPSGVISKLGGRQNTSDFRLAAGTFMPIETNGQPINQVIQGLPYKDVTPGLLALIDKITSQAQAVGGVADTPTAEGIQNVPVGTMMAQIEQATKVMSAAFKGMHQAQAEEIELIVELFKQNPEDFWKSNKICGKDFWNEQKFLQALNDCNLVPRSDPNTPSHIHRVAKGVALAQLIAIPAFTPIMNPTETLQRILAVIREDPAGLIQAPPAAAPQPNPQLIAAEAKMTQATTGAQKAQADAQNAQQENQIKQAELATEQNIATVNLAKEMVIHKADAANAQKTAGLEAVQGVHDRQMDLAEHALNVHQALQPPATADSGGGNGGSS